MDKEILEEPHFVEELVVFLRGSFTQEELQEKLADYHENDIAGALELLTIEERKKIYPLLDKDLISEIFAYIEDPDEYIKELEIHDAAKVLENMDSDDAVDILEEMDDSTQQALTRLMDEEASSDIQMIQSYDDEEIGSKMTTNFIIIDKSMTIKEAMRSLVKQAEKNDNISTLYVEDDDHSFYGAIDLKDLITARHTVPLEDLISTSYPYVSDHEKISECFDRIVDYAEDSIPVLNENREVLGIITSQDLVEVVDEEMGDDYAKFAGLTSEEELEEPLKESMRKRLPWLIILLFLGIGVSTVVGIFEGVVAQLAIVVCFQSLILDMAGNVGTQSLAVTIRVLTDENLKTWQKIKLVFKEIRVGLCNGLLLGIMTFLVIGFYITIIKHNTWQYGFLVASCVGVALLVSMIVSSFVGTIVPLFFHKIKVDPAVASGPLITTVNDLVAVVTYYGLAWVLLINIFHLV